MLSETIKFCPPVRRGNDLQEQPPHLNTVNTYRFKGNNEVKFTDNAAAINLFRDGDYPAYRGEVVDLTTWCQVRERRQVPESPIHRFHLSGCSSAKFSLRRLKGFYDLIDCCSVESTMTAHVKGLCATGGFMTKAPDTGASEEWLPSGRP
ncbi:unnamed protein product [Pleuronectes platessa]|uniref:Uncharacterized protein n=1 Tax=Pleuronectes platessa TaxID=8262 RepID=A0A9N7YDZ1_PLEPL|nr:unnamed protein product [Pleuronectes platessa]